MNKKNLFDNCVSKSFIFVSYCIEYSILKYPQKSKHQQKPVFTFFFFFFQTVAEWSRRLSVLYLPNTFYNKLKIFYFLFFWKFKIIEIWQNASSVEEPPTYPRTGSLVKWISFSYLKLILILIVNVFLLIILEKVFIIGYHNISTPTFIC